MWMNFILSLIWMLGVTFSTDEMTMRFKGYHGDRIRMTYKAECDGYRNIIFLIKDKHIK